MSKVAAVILAAGSGSRMGAAKPKQFLTVAGRPIFIHTLLEFDKIECIESIILVLSASSMALAGSLIEAYSFRNNVEMVCGGRTRQESSYKGVKSCPESAGTVVIHDAVRPFAEEGIIRRVIDAALEHKASSCSITCGDTIAVSEGGLIKSVPDRKKMVRIQTPQAFDRDMIVRAHETSREKGLADFTDDCGMVLEMGGRVKLVEGSERNIKITRPFDIVLAEKFLENKKEDKKC